ncbi:MAG: hypothetical protein V7K88_02985 [Nostoc sp.]|uniref:Cap15 family cyclic dinucleotide receptor domain-containing protein n=1 Tax=Nostoc sp. TaxID=1180 RepID=UPI002FFC89D4
MNEIEIKKLITITVVLSIIVSIASIFLFSVNILSFGIFRIFSMTITFLTLFWAFYFKWGWKMPVLKKIFDRPNLNGTWSGTYNSEDNNKKEYFGKIVLTIRQSFLFIHFISITDKFVSYSSGETLLNNENKGLKQVTYFYSQKRLKSDEKNIPQGASELSIMGDEKEKLLYGDFWTNRPTKGFLKLKFVSSNCVESYQEAEKNWCNQEQWMID